MSFDSFWQISHLPKYVELIFAKLALSELGFVEFMKIQEFTFNIDFWVLYFIFTTCQLGNLDKWIFMTFNLCIRKIVMMKVLLSSMR